MIAVEHDPNFLAACDWLVEMGPGGGPDGGRVIAEGRPQQLAGGTSPMAAHLAAALST